MSEQSIAHLDTQEGQQASQRVCAKQLLLATCCPLPLSHPQCAEPNVSKPGLVKDLLQDDAKRPHPLNPTKPHPRPPLPRKVTLGSSGIAEYSFCPGMAR